MPLWKKIGNMRKFQASVPLWIVCAQMILPFPWNVQLIRNSSKWRKKRDTRTKYRYHKLFTTWNHIQFSLRMNLPWYFYYPSHLVLISPSSGIKKSHYQLSPCIFHLSMIAIYAKVLHTKKASEPLKNSIWIAQTVYQKAYP